LKIFAECVQDPAPLFAKAGQGYLKCEQVSRPAVNDPFAQGGNAGKKTSFLQCWQRDPIVNRTPSDATATDANARIDATQFQAHTLLSELILAVTLSGIWP
jgi:hypothetical protein